MVDEIVLTRGFIRRAEAKEQHPVRQRRCKEARPVSSRAYKDVIELFGYFRTEVRSLLLLVYQCASGEVEVLCEDRSRESLWPNIQSVNK